MTRIPRTLIAAGTEKEGRRGQGLRERVGVVFIK